MISHVQEREDVNTTLKCYHCGQLCKDVCWMREKAFCCYDCKTVFEILQSNDLCDYYTLDTARGNSLKEAAESSFSYLDESQIRTKILTFDSDTFAKTSFQSMVKCGDISAFVLRSEKT